jgi:hypothetical protein
MLLLIFFATRPAFESFLYSRNGGSRFILVSSAASAESIQPGAAAFTVKRHGKRRAAGAFG